MPIPETLHRPYRAPSLTIPSYLGLTPQAISHRPFRAHDLSWSDREATFHVLDRHDLAACCRGALSAPTARTGMLRRAHGCVPLRFHSGLWIFLRCPECGRHRKEEPNAASVGVESGRVRSGSKGSRRYRELEGHSTNLWDLFLGTGPGGQLAGRRFGAAYTLDRITLSVQDRPLTEYGTEHCTGACPDNRNPGADGRHRGDAESKPIGQQCECR